MYLFALEVGKIYRLNPFQYNKSAKGYSATIDRLIKISYPTSSLLTLVQSPSF
jgi:hypothetical protein